MTKAQALAVQLGLGPHLIKALASINPARREDAKELLAAAGLSHTDAASATAILGAIAGAKSVHRDLTPV